MIFLLLIIPWWLIGSYLCLRTLLCIDEGQLTKGDILAIIIAGITGPIHILWYLQYGPGKGWFYEVVWKKNKTG